MKIFDCHNDFLTELKTPLAQKAYIKHLKKYFSGKILSIVWTTKLKEPIEQIKKFCNEIKNNKKLILSIEDLHFLTPKNYIKNTKTLKKLGTFSCGIVWNNKNRLGSGAFSRGGLTPFGIEVVKSLEKKGILIDTAHMNRQTFWDFAKITTLPLFCSHTNLAELHEHKRNLNETQIQKIILSKGLFCLSFVGDFISNKKTSIEDVARQIAYFLKKYGVKNLAIGSDFFGSTNLPEGLASYADFAMLKLKLKKLGIKNRTINKIFYKNMDHFYHKIKKITKKTPKQCF